MTPDTDTDSQTGSKSPIESPIESPIKAIVEATPSSFFSEPADSRALAEIKLLASEVIDQIAAGEVVERPAHLVKELVENAIDAGAGSIEVEYDQGGRHVRVTDDGYGIKSSQLILALARHATSKIDQSADLYRLSSFGFRGEALASIAAVSRLSLQSRPRESDTAYQVACEFGRLTPAEPIGGNFGTTILVEELFSNIPARLKFLKSESGENAQIKNTLKALALANHGVEFRIRSKGRLDHVWKKTDSLIERSKQILEASKLFSGQSEFDGYRAEVAFASPHEVTGNSRQIWIFVQGRWVQDRSLQAAVLEAYRGLLMHGEYPIVVVRLEVPPDEIDVNIHPTKSQVKFRNSQAAFRAVHRVLRDALEKAPWLVRDHAVSVSAAVSAFATRSEAESRKMTVAELTRPYSASPKAVRESISELKNESSRGENPPFSPSDDSDHKLDSFDAAVPGLKNSPVNSLGRFEAEEFNTILFKEKSDVHQFDAQRSGAERSNAPESDTPESGLLSAKSELGWTGGAWSRLQVLGQANLTYILAQDGDRLVLVDQHAAHERVAYERLMRAWLGGKVDVQPLLIPIAIDLEPDGAEALLACASDLLRLGVELDQTGPQQMAICAMPAAIKERGLVRALQDLARESTERGGSFALERKISDLCATMACHSVVRAGQSLSHDQMRSLLAQMDEFALSSFCPHGRPVSVDYPFAKLERDFGRLV